MDDATRVLLHVLKSHFEQSQTLAEAWQEAPRVAMTHISRPGWPGSELRLEQKKLIEQQLRKFSEPYVYSNELKSLLRFAQQAVALVVKLTQNKSETELQKQRLVGLIKSEQMEGQTGDVAAARAAARFMQIKRREQRGKTYVGPDKDNRLLEILSLPKSIGAELPKQDIRGIILKSSLADLLKQASCFSPDVLKSILGDELYRQVKPIGFADRMQKIILIQVPSASVAHEMSFRKMELLMRLHQLKEFSDVSDIRFSIKA